MKQAIFLIFFFAIGYKDKGQTPGNISKDYVIYYGDTLRALHLDYEKVNPDTNSYYHPVDTPKIGISKGIRDGKPYSYLVSYTDSGGFKLYGKEIFHEEHTFESVEK